MSRVKVPLAAAPMVDGQRRPTQTTQRLLADIERRLNAAIALDTGTATAADIINALKGDS